MIRKGLSLFLCAAVLFFAGFHALYAQDKVVAIVNNEIITQKDLEGFIAFMRVQLAKEYGPAQMQQKIDSMRNDLIERLVEDRLILQEARKANISIDKNRIKAKISELKRAHNSDQEFREYLFKQGMTEADLENKLRDQMMTYEIVDNKIKSRIVVKPSEITDYFVKNPDQFMVPEQREFLSIVLETQPQADKVSVDLKAGKSAPEIEKEYSVKTNTFTAKMGGELKKELEDVVSSLGTGAVSDAVKIGDVFYVFKLLRIIPLYQQQLIDVQSDINKMLSDKRMQEDMVSWLDELKKKAYIKYMQSDDKPQ